MRKIGTNATAIGLSLCMMTAAANARPGGGAPGGGAHFGGVPGGGAHFGGVPGGGMHVGGIPGGGMHVGGVPGGAPHFGAGPRLAPHGVPNFTARTVPHFTAHGVGPHLSAHGGPHPGNPALHTAAHELPGRTHGLDHQGFDHHGLDHGGPLGNNHGLTTGGRPTGFSHVGFGANPRTFAARRQFAANTAFGPFWNHGWHWHHHLGWIGPLFWPYAYGDVFYYTLWPYDYGEVDPIWVYGYDDIYQGIFSPYTYDQYVQGPAAPARMKALTQSVAQSCVEEAAEVTSWPINQIQAAVQPSAEQGALLDELGNAVVKASDVIKSHCPTNVAFTPIGRLDAMQERLGGMVEAVNIISPALSKFYDSLSDEQKARFNDMAPPDNQHAAPQASNTPNPQAGNPPNPRSECDAPAMAWPTEQIERVVRPTEAQRAKLDALQAAAAQAADIIKSACPSEPPSTPPARLAAVGKHLEAMLQAVQTTRPALVEFYNSLSDDQKARFNTLGTQLFAQNQQ